MLLIALPARAQDPQPATAAAQAPAPRRLVVDLDFAAAGVHDDSLRTSLGRERQMKVPYAIVGLSGDLNANVSYRVEFNGVNDSVRPEPFIPSAKTPFFFPNEPDQAYGVPSSPEGQWKVDDYKHIGLDPYIQNQHLRRAYLDVHPASRRYGLIVGQFFVPIGLPLEEARWFTAKDLAHIQRIHAKIDAGVALYYRGARGDRDVARIDLVAVTGNGNPYHDYVYFDHSRSSFEDTNSAMGAVGSVRLFPIDGLQLAFTYEYNLVGSRIERDTSLQRSKHYDDKLVGGVKFRPSPSRRFEVFGEVVRYKWGLKDTSAELLETATPIWKDGLYVGVDAGVPVRGNATVGAVVLYEDLDRDDSLVVFLAERNVLGVRRGERERATIVKAYAEFEYWTAFFFYTDLDNPFPQVSAIVPIAGPRAFVSQGNRKVGGGIRVRVTF